MKKQSYEQPDTQVLYVSLECNMLASGDANGSGSNLGDPFNMTGDQFDSIFG